MVYRFFCFCATLRVLVYPVIAQDISYDKDPFRQLEEILPTPNVYRTASGSPGPQYWQQRADYEIRISLDDENQRLTGWERIRYSNKSPDTLTYLWVQLDQNRFRFGSGDRMTKTAPPLDRLPFKSLAAILKMEDSPYGHDITRVADSAGQPLRHRIVDTMMRIDLPQPLGPGATMEFEIEWAYTMVDNRDSRTRGACEYFKEDDNYIYEVAQWYPRVVAYTDSTGWHHKQFLGRGEFTLEFGNYEVAITVPADHVVASTGVLQNPGEVLTAAQRERLAEAENAEQPVFIVTPEEAGENQKEKSGKTQTWVFKAENVRDFAWASSRKFIWDAQRHNCEGNNVWAMSYYPNEGEPLWSRYSTQSIIHTLNVYSRFTFAYPYPVAISVNGPVGGMEYPMICFNGPRPEKDKTYSAGTKYGLISVIIHEVGHNYFPMIVNSDERQWTWMDEGLNTFLQFLAEQEWQDKYPSRRGYPRDIVGYMRSSAQMPIMTNSESILQFGANAYAKPATALNILRETILGRELFDVAFKEFAQRWRFKRPQPADFFRTIEDASGVDLDWFWRGWFYTTRHCDMGISNLRLFEIDTLDPDVEKTRKQEERDDRPRNLTIERNRNLEKRANLIPELKDFYNDYDVLEVTDKDRRSYQKTLGSLSDEQKAMLKSGKKLYVVDLQNHTGLVMPVILEAHFEGGETMVYRYPAEIWRRSPRKVSRMIVCEREIERLVLDPYLETADASLENNHWPRKIITSRFKLFKQSHGGNNPMREAGQEEKRKKEEAKQKEEKAEKKPKNDKKVSEKNSKEKANREDRKKRRERRKQRKRNRGDAS